MKIDKAKTRESSNTIDEGINKRISIYTESYKGEYYNKFKENAKIGYRYVKENYSIESFCQKFLNLLNSTF